jgi:tyrosyl-tRNA synthetase
MGAPKYNLVDELRWRNMLHDMKPGTEELLKKEMVKGYVGFDPTADSLGVGNLVQVMTLLHFQKAGHKPYALIGGATGMVGDPSGKSEERNLLNEDVLNHNLACQKKQLEKFLDFNCGENSAEIVNNYDWFKGISFLEFIRDTGKYITVNYMMAKDSVKNRITRTGEDDETSGMSFTEFTYQLVQGYDFYYLWKHYGIKMQMGGSDQWGNILTGTELIRRKDQGEAFAYVTPLIKKADGTKFGKTESGNLWLDPKRTSPYKFYQFWLNAADEDVKNYIRIFTLFPQEEVLELEKQHAAEPHMRHLQKALAKDITIRVHSVKDYERAVETSTILFGNSFDAFKSLNPEEIESAFDEKETFKLGAHVFENEVDAVSLLGEHTNVYTSKGEAKRAIQGNAVSVNKEKIKLETKLDRSALLYDKYLLIQKGKKEYFLMVVG